MAEVQIVVVEGPNEGREFDLSGSTTVGRDPSAGLVIDDAEASRKHASLSVEGETVTVEDLGSTNGTFVNGTRLTGPHALAQGEKLRIGTTVFELHVAPEQATRVGTALPDLDDIQVTAPRNVPDFAKEPPAAPDPEPTAPQTVAPPSGPPQTTAPPPSSGPPGGAGAPPVPPAGPPPPAGGPPPPPSFPPPPAGGPPPPPSSPPPSFGPPPGAPAEAPPPPAYGVPNPGYGGMLAPSPYAAPAGAQLSGWWRRVGAVLLDALISIPFLVIGYVFIVAPLLMKRDGAHNGQTWGKQALGIRVVKNDGQPYTFGTAFLRDVLVKALCGAIPIVSLLNNLWPLWDPQNEALHDKLAGSHVLKT